jgi:hypothetical protein
MNPKQMTVAAALAAGVAASGCSHPDPKQPKLNPHPKQVYEITLTVHDAPGPFESATFFVYYEVPDSPCLPRNTWVGAPTDTPTFTAPVEQMKRVGDNVYQGQVTLDLLEDEDYYGKGVCRWTNNMVNAGLNNHGVYFGTSVNQNQIQAGKEITYYFLKEDYFDPLKHGRFAGDELGQEDLQAIPESDRSSKLFSTTFTVRRITS